ncbi:hypothetical protein RHSIM_Rhsim05G0054900 [Rhododendron simsii]|uniref:DUF4216 domain-containing protein n=1 Tax=Rhododendron simsii TaxID=118357 RepID=A0A834HA02_RHOSS|nr:hypothetical protein RHSIM_Rhsim05G0054900 [Rhododendron simsii]
MSWSKVFKLPQFAKNLHQSYNGFRCSLEAPGLIHNFMGTNGARNGWCFSSEYRGFMTRCEIRTGSLSRCGQFLAPRTPCLDKLRQYATHSSREQKSNKMLIYLTGLVFAMVGCSYAAVPLYRRFCQATGYGGTVQRRESVEEKIARHAQDGTVTTREIVVQFNADVADGMPRKFIHTQREVLYFIMYGLGQEKVHLHFTLLRIKVQTPITGVSTYNVTPMKVAVYFNKIQCFCFEEQRLLPGEQIDMLSDSYEGDEMHELLYDAFGIPPFVPPTDDTIELSDEIKILAMRPSDKANRYSGYLINGANYHTKSRELRRKTQNSGIMVKANTSSYASAKDMNPEGEVTYYGYVMDIVELYYSYDRRHVLFMCDWIDNDKGLRHDDFGFTLVNFKHLLYTKNQERDEPFVLASQAQQIFYIQDPVEDDWNVVIKMKPRGYSSASRYHSSSANKDGVFGVSIGDQGRACCTLPNQRQRTRARAKGGLIYKLPLVFLVLFVSCIFCVLFGGLRDLDFAADAICAAILLFYEVFFYIDPEFETDPKMDGINNLILSYTFFKVSEEQRTTAPNISICACTSNKI